LITPPKNPSPVPDKYTKKEPAHTSPEADGRVFYISLLFARYGTDDKSHGAAVLLSILTLAVIFVLICIGVKTGVTPWLDRAFTWLGSAFLFLAGVAVGRTPPKNGKPEDK
jgi:peptidoglycan/LPS O-acetylase OafA/YrhL